MTDFGCIPKNVKDKVVNNTLLIEPQKVVVLEKNEKFGGIDTKGNMLIPVTFDGIYSTINAGETSYYLLYNDKEYNAVEYIRLIKEQLGIVDDEENEEDTNNMQDTNITVEDTNSIQTNAEASNENATANGSQNEHKNTENTAE